MKKIIYLIIVLILTGCVTTSVVMPEYKSRRDPGKSMGIIAGNIIVKCPKDVKDDLGEGDTDAVFNEYFENLFTRNIREGSNLSALGYNPKADTSSFMKRLLIVNEETQFDAKIPQDGSIVKTRPVYFDYILILDELLVDRVSEVNFAASKVISGDLSVGLSRKKSLQFKYKYIIWDNGKKQILAYGTQTIANDFSIALTKKKWDGTVEKMAKQILVDTPFDGAKLKTKR